MFKWLVSLLIMLAVIPVSAQYDLLSEGELVAHDVQRTGLMPEALRQLLGNRKFEHRQLSSRRHIQSPFKARAIRRGQALASSHTIGPLLQSIRDQEEPYNLLCPRWIDDDGQQSDERCLSGCVATSIEQILAYYRYPEALLDTLFGWTTDHYVLDDLLPGTRFDWDNYLQDYRDGWTQEQGMAIALPTLAAGMAVHMNYGIGSSGASTYRAVEPLQRAFGYGMARYFDRILYTPQRWHAMLLYELQNNRPIAYVGHNMTMGGHAFNIDGVDNRGYYHVNWGYGGNYDGWYDLDWLNPWEPTDYPLDGMAQGFFCNQGALFMHPSSEMRPLEPDTLSLDSLGVKLLAVDFLRQPDLQGYVPADFHFLNTGTDSVTYTYEVMTYLPTDTAIFYQADYVGLAGLTLAPGETRTQRVYLQFMEAGERIFGISHDDETIPFIKPIQIAKGTLPVMEWGDVVGECLPMVDDLFSYTFSISVRNQAADGFAGDMVTFCLFADGQEEEDARHYRVLSTPAGQTEELQVTFSYLTPATHYTLLVRCPWKVKQQIDFTTPVATTIRTPWQTGIHGKADTDRYDLGGRRISDAAHGIVIQNRRKWLHK